MPAPADQSISHSPVSINVVRRSLLSLNWCRSSGSSITQSQPRSFIGVTVISRLVGQWIDRGHIGTVGLSGEERNGCWSGGFYSRRAGRYRSSGFHGRRTERTKELGKQVLSPVPKRLSFTIMLRPCTDRTDTSEKRVKSDQFGG